MLVLCIHSYTFNLVHYLQKGVLISHDCPFSQDNHLVQENWLTSSSILGYLVFSFVYMLGIHFLGEGVMSLEYRGKRVTEMHRREVDDYDDDDDNQPTSPLTTRSFRSQADVCLPTCK